jgi:hypothetical protein
MKERNWGDAYLSWRVETQKKMKKKEKETSKST